MAFGGLLFLIFLAHYLGLCRSMPRLELDKTIGVILNYELEFLSVLGVLLVLVGDHG